MKLRATAADREEQIMFGHALRYGQSKHVHELIGQLTFARYCSVPIDAVVRIGELNADFFHDGSSERHRHKGHEIPCVGRRDSVGDKGVA